MSALLQIQSTLLDYSDLANIGARLIPIVESACKENAIFRTLLDNLKIDQQQLRDVMNRTQGSALTNKLSSLDSCRDNAIRAFKYNLLAWSMRDTMPQEQQAASILLQKMESFGPIYNEGYSAESHLLYLLFELLDKPESQQLIGTVGATAWYQEIKNTQTDFEKCMEERTEEAASKADLPLLKNASDSLLQSINSILDYMKIMVSVEPSRYTAFVKNAEVVISDVMSTARARRTKKSNEEKRELEPQTV